MRDRRALGLLVPLALVGCTAEIGARFNESERGADVDADDPDPVEASRELCGNEVDDDEDGTIDEDCGCELGQARPCYPGPAGTAGVGLCQAGIQPCEDHFEFPSWGACEGAVLPKLELLNGLDDDCDGSIDCEPGDDRCADADPCALNPQDPACAGAPPSLCPDGQTPTFRSTQDPGYGGSSIVDGDGGEPMSMTCEEGLCAEGQAAVVDELYGTTVCVEAPPACAEGTSPDYRPSVGGREGEGFFPGDENPDGVADEGAGSWVCSPPCDIVVHYGGIYGSLTVCTAPPDIVCEDAGLTPTFVFETEQWECLPMCDNGLYDQINFEGGILCVPC